MGSREVFLSAQCHDTFVLAHDFDRQANAGPNEIGALEKNGGEGPTVRTTLVFVVGLQLSTIVRRVW